MEAMKSQFELVWSRTLPISSLSLLVFSFFSVITPQLSVWEYYLLSCNFGSLGLAFLPNPQYSHISSLKNQRLLFQVYTRGRSYRLWVWNQLNIIFPFHVFKHIERPFDMSTPMINWRTAAFNPFVPSQQTQSNVREQHVLAGIGNYATFDIEPSSLDLADPEEHVGAYGPNDQGLPGPIGRLSDYRGSSGQFPDFFGREYSLFYNTCC